LRIATLTGDRFRLVEIARVELQRLVLIEGSGSLLNCDFLGNFPSLIRWQEKVLSLPQMLFSREVRNNAILF
jgi:hypothetical protein